VFTRLWLNWHGHNWSYTKVDFIARYGFAPLIFSYGFAARDVRQGFALPVGSYLIKWAMPSVRALPQVAWAKGPNRRHSPEYF